MILYIMLAAIGLLQIADVYTTNLVLTKRGGFNPAREGNPFLRWVMERTGRAWWVVKLIIAGVMILAIYRAGGPLSYALGAIVFAAYAWVVHHNWQQYRR